MKKLLITGLASAAMLSAASAAVTLTLTGTSGSNVLSYQISGTGSFDNTITTDSEIVLSLNTDYMSDGFATFTFPNNISGTGTLSNDTASESADLASIGITNGGSNDQITLSYTASLENVVTNTESYTFTGSGTITVSTFFDTNGIPRTFDFDDLIIGSHTATDASDPFGGFTLVVQDASSIPEPSSAALFGLAGLGLLMRRRR